MTKHNNSLIYCVRVTVAAANSAALEEKQMGPARGFMMMLGVLASSFRELSDAVERTVSESTRDLSVDTVILELDANVVQTNELDRYFPEEIDESMLEPGVFFQSGRMFYGDDEKSLLVRMSEKFRTLLGK